eukprot:TRINITY_DN94706_c0_g1_i1.p1 TRINITY_DN94706_c0_g1~~TRINITY_DN94706_c0_g1_i1.p1  ORF type:complete len:359 (-),score=73.55 TRINITY_DN94706_c0_g1_i1:2-1078(-)
MPAAAGLSADLLSGTDLVHNSAFPTSLKSCPRPVPKPLQVQAPPCLEGGLDCRKKNEKEELREFARAMDKSLEEPLKNAKLARKRFERRVCDFRYAELDEKGQVLIDAYGPHGPMRPGGSYLYELRRWADAVQELDNECLTRAGDGCANLLGFMKNYPEADIQPHGGHGALGSELYNEIRMACEVGKTRAPVPNSSPVWCDTSTGLCEQTSCRNWWHDVHPLQVDPKPWVDDRVEYDQLKQACTSIMRPKYTAADLDKFQKKAEKEAVALKREFCTPKWVDGYCESKKPPVIHAKCVLDSGQYCKQGTVQPGSESNITSMWEEGIKEPPVQVEALPLLPVLLLPRKSPQRADLVKAFL